MECRKVVNLLSDYLDGMLADNEAGRIEGHLTACAPCQSVKVDLLELRSAARDLPLHTPQRALWTRISNVVEAEMAAEKARITAALPKASLWERMKAMTFTLTLPQMAGATALALALLAFSAANFYRQAGADLSFGSMKTAVLFPEEDQIKTELERKLEAVKARMSNWNPQRRAEFEQNLNRIEESLQNCRQLLQANPNDQAHQVMMRNLYSEKRQLLEDVERLKW